MTGIEFCAIKNYSFCRVFLLIKGRKNFRFGGESFLFSVFFDELFSSIIAERTDKTFGEMSSVSFHFTHHSLFLGWRLEIYKSEIATVKIVFSDAFLKILRKFCS